MSKEKIKHISKHKEWQGYFLSRGSNKNSFLSQKSFLDVKEHKPIWKRYKHLGLYTIKDTKRFIRITSTGKRGFKAFLKKFLF